MDVAVEWLMNALRGKEVGPYVNKTRVVCFWRTRESLSWNLAISLQAGYPLIMQGVGRVSEACCPWVKDSLGFFLYLLWLCWVLD